MLAGYGCMQPETRKYLWDAVAAIDLVRRFTSGKLLEDYLSDELLRSAVERQSEIVGEALSQMARIDPETAGRVPELRRIIAFRNILAHGYGEVKDEAVWDILSIDMPALREVLTALLEAG